MRRAASLLHSLDANATAATAGEGYASIDKLASESRPGANGLLFAPWLSGERAPFRDANARGCFIGLSPRSSLADLHRAVLEGVCYSFRSLCDLVLGTHAHAPLRQLRAVGGGSRSAVWMQLMADILQCDVVVMRDGHNTGARGVALLAGIGQGWYDGLDQRVLPPDFFPTGERFVARGGGDADLAWQYAAYDNMYGVYSRLHLRLRDTFAELANITHTPPDTTATSPATAAP